jgi:DNA phosphorothioation-dependent restriction protein DptH
MTSPQWLKHLKTGISGLEDVAESQLASLAAGDALVWAQRSTDKRFTQRPYKVQIRPTIQPSRRWNENGGPKCNRQIM